MYYKGDIMRVSFNYALIHGHPVPLRCLLGTVILPWDIRDARMVWLTGAPTGAPKPAHIVQASDAFCKVNLCMPLQTGGKAMKGVRTAGKAVK